MKTVELYNANSEMYWNLDEFLKATGYKNVQEYCAHQHDTLGTKEYCTQIVRDDMYKQANEDLEIIIEDNLEYLFNNYYVTVKPISKCWNGTYKGELQNVKHISDVLNYEVVSISIIDNCLRLVVSHHDGRNIYDLYFSNYKLYENESESDYMEYVVHLYKLWERGDI